MQRYEEYKKILNTATAQFEAIDVKAATVAVLISKLFSLKNHGMKIKNLYEGQNRSHNVEIKNYEYVHPTILSLNAEASTPQTNRKTPSSKTPQKGQNQSQVEDNQPQNSSIKRRRRRTPRKPRNKCSSPLENENHLPGPPPPHLQPSPHFQRQPSPYFQGSPLLHAQKQSPRPPPPVHFGPPPQQFRAPQPNFPLPPPHFQLPPPPRHYKQYSVPNYQNFPPTSSFNLPYQDGRSQIQGGCFQHNQQHTQQQWSPGPSKGNNLSSNAAGQYNFFCEFSRKREIMLYYIFLTFHPESFNKFFVLLFLLFFNFGIKIYLNEFTKNNSNFFILKCSSHPLVYDVKVNIKIVLVSITSFLKLDEILHITLNLII